MTASLLRIVVLAGTLLGLVPGSASAQFETPNRSFHNSTAFRLDGKHQTVPCASCHLNGQFRGTPATCYDCHWVRRQDDRFQTRLGTQCEQCHRPTSWTAVRFDHAAAGVPLNANHRQIDCGSCHRDGNVRAASVTCVSCHQRDFEATTAPNHRAVGFPPTCESCHTPNDATFARSGAGGFSHAAIFPLVGVHATATCQACHKNNLYLGTPRDCVGCHLPNYTATQSPNHVAAGLPTTCESCHRPTDTQWAGAAFNHNTVFALVGRHATTACASCHKNNIYRGTPRDCVGCHRANYDATRNPSHTAAGFPTTCETCHRAADSAWTQGQFTHAWFPLRGNHNRPCAQCHTTANNFKVFSCTICHSRSETDSHHRGRSGYVYDSVACYSCHPNGRS